jgi:beta-1,4-N-acetylglucosaminyltransferase
LRLGKPLVVVPNPLLMDNHQAELAAKLEEMHHLFAATPDSLADVIRGMDVASLVPYEKGDPAGIAAEIDTAMAAKRG